MGDGGGKYGEEGVKKGFTPLGLIAIIKVDTNLGTKTYVDSKRRKCSKDI